jgi:hypothetical protein
VKTPSSQEPSYGYGIHVGQLGRISRQPAGAHVQPRCFEHGYEIGHSRRPTRLIRLQ